MQSGFDLEYHNKVFKDKGWTHDSTCNCKNPAFLKNAKAEQRLDFNPVFDVEDQSQRLKAFGEG